ncbi:hypothetical protein KDN24_20100, partial [Bacillus sp. Bva_UNVM-123]|uniref:hypothetical protein n=1 Tax=Bacillus sp. Bva_UNVM-123 TaxID=2829798 RepID=UPI00391FADF5
MFKNKTNLTIGILIVFIILFNVSIQVTKANNNVYELEPGNSVSISFPYKNDTSYVRVYIRNGSFDFAKYTSRGTYSSLFQGEGDYYFDIYGNQEAVVTNTSRSTIKISTASKLVEISGRGTPALKKEQIDPGETIKVQNKSTSSASYKVGGAHDNATYDKTGNIKNYRINSSSGTQNVYVDESMVVTNSGKKGYEVIAPYKLFTFSGRSTPATFKKVIKNGDTVEFKSISSNNFNLYFNHNNYDYATYSNDKLTSYGVLGSNSTNILSSGQMIVTNQSNEELEVRGPYDGFTLISRNISALHREKLQNGKSIKVTNNSNTSLRLQLEGTYDYAQYYSNGQVVSYGENISDSVKNLSKGSSIVITNLNGDSVRVIGPREDVKWENSLNPALSKLTIQEGNSLDVTNQNSYLTAISLNGVYDYSFYDGTNQVSSHYQKQQIKKISVDSKQRLALTNTGEKPQEIYAPYGVFDFHTRASSVTYSETLLPGKSIEFKNKTTNTFSNYLSGQYDYVYYSNIDNVINFRRDEKSNHFKLGNKTRLVLTNVGTSAIVIEGPRDAIEINGRSNPALIKQTIAPESNVEFKYKKDSSSTTVHLTGKHDYALYNAQKQIISYLTRTSAGSANLGVGNRLAVMNTADEAIEAYGVYDLLEVSQRSTPVTFTEKLPPGESIELKNTATSEYSVKLTGEYDFVTYSASDSVQSFNRDVKATTSKIGSQSRLA